MLFWVLLLAPVVLIFIYLKRINQHWADKNVPYVKPWLLFGNMGKIVVKLETQPEMLERIYYSHDTRYVGMHSFLTPALLIKDVDLLKQIGIKEFDHFVDRNQAIKEEMDPLFGKNLGSLKEDKWRNMRSTLSPAFTGSKMRGMFVLISECAEKFTNYLVENTNPNETLTLELKDTFTRFANDVIATTAFGIECNSMKEKDNDFYLMGKDITNFNFVRIMKFFILQTFPIMANSLKITFMPTNTSNYFKNIIKDNIKSREEQGIIRPDMIHLLLEARKGKLKHEENIKDEVDGFASVEESDIGKQKEVKNESITDEDITAQALIFFLAGFETISTTLCHTVYELVLNEDIQEKLQKEIDETINACKGNITYEALMKMKYLDMVLTESLRKWPPAPSIDRECTKTFTIEPENPGEIPVTINKGDAVWFPIYPLQRDPRYFPNPEKFDPERFSDENKGNISPLTYIPFGIGPRNCIGSRFALLEVKTLLFHMLSKFNFVVVKKTQIPLKLAKLPFSMLAENGFWVGLKLRNK